MLKRKLQLENVEIAWTGRKEGGVEHSTCKSHVARTHWPTSTWSCPSHQGHPSGSHTPVTWICSTQIQRSRNHSQKPTASEPSVAGPRLSLSLAVFVAPLSPPISTTCFFLSFMWQTVTSVIRFDRVEWAPRSHWCLVNLWLVVKRACHRRDMVG